MSTVQFAVVMLAGALCVVLGMVAAALISRRWR